MAAELAMSTDKQRETELHNLLDDLEQQWTDNKTVDIAKVLTQQFSSSDNPFALVLFILDNAKQMQTSKNIIICAENL